MSAREVQGKGDEGYILQSMRDIEEDNLLQDGSLDYKGRVARRNKTGGWKTAPLLFGPETCEKTAVLGIATNIVPYLTRRLHLPSSYSADLVTTYQGTSYLLTLLGGFLADALIGRFWVIIGGATTMICGLLLLTLSASLPLFQPKSCDPEIGSVCPPQYGTPLIVIYVSVYLLAMGTAGIKSCASAFGADQFDPSHHEEKRGLAGFFSWYFFTMSCGGFFAATVLVWIQDNEGRRWGYLIPTLLTMMVVTAVLAGRKFYRYKAPKGSPLTQIAQVVVAAYKKRNLPLPTETTMLFELKQKDQPFDYVRVNHSDQLKFLDKAAIEVDRASELGGRSLWVLNSVTRVEETKMVIRLVPIIVTTSLFYTVFAQMTTFSIDQATTLQRTLGQSFVIPPASMNAFLQASILLTLYLWETCVIPIARRFTGNEKGTTSIQRIGVGLVMSILTVTVAAFVERKRLAVVKSEHLGNHLQTDGTSEQVDMSIFWLLPQFILAGAGEALTYAAQLDFFYNETPKGMRSMGSALCICTRSMGYYTSTLLVSIVNSLTRHKRSDGSRGGEWLPGDINRGRLDKFYGLLAVASTINFLLFQGCAHWYKYKALGDRDAEDERMASTSSVELTYTDLNGKGASTSRGDSGLIAAIKTAPNNDYELEVHSPQAKHRSSLDLSGNVHDNPQHQRQRSVKY